MPASPKLMEKVSFVPQVDQCKYDEKQARADDRDPRKLSNAEYEGGVEKPHAHSEKSCDETEFSQPENPAGADVEKD